MEKEKIISEIRKEIDLNEHLLQSSIKENDKTTFMYVSGKNSAYNEILKLLNN